MKRLLCLLLATVLLLGGCSGKKVSTPLTWATIDAIPVATEDMTEEQLRVEGVERVPEGTTHCVEARELSPTLLEVDLTEYPPDADPVLIRQRVRLVQNPDGTWGIVSITPAG